MNEIRESEMTAAVIITILLVPPLLICCSCLYFNYMRYEAFATAQSTVLSCRAKAGFKAADKLCGPVPSMVDFK